ncbi:hypothetical protein FAF44_09645 [Nonomuraea sp. MG754425]|uniref:hypothetical protein n=1 Tax=Nonomuraea sp. MG754425 TaxID=2570319 RepID=UPI001F2D15CE|nr:hypothetical protein [Nonomuraea sp. MG754425]MCF6468647.1 hypothetical protein [Nonomuraea sp. MG754425]
MTVFVITFLLGCLSVMTVRGKRGNWPAGMPVARPRLVAVGGTYEGGRGVPSDAYVVQERLVAAARGVGGALALGAVVAARPQHGEQSLDECVRAARDASRRGVGTGPAGDLDLVVLERAESPLLRFAHVGDGEIWHCPRGAEPLRLTAPRGSALPAAPDPEVGSVVLRPGDRVAIVSAGAVEALGAARMRELFGGGTSPGACLDRLYDEMAAVEPGCDATVIIAEFVTA